MFRRLKRQTLLNILCLERTKPGWYFNQSEKLAAFKPFHLKINDVNDLYVRLSYNV